MDSWWTKSKMSIIKYLHCTIGITILRQKLYKNPKTDKHGFCEVQKQVSIIKTKTRIWRLYLFPNIIINTNKYDKK